MQEMRKNTRLIRGIVSVCVILAVVGLDQLTKLLVASHMELHESITLIPGVLRLTYITNPAAAMGLFGNCRWLFMILSPVAVIAILIYLFRAKKVGGLYTAALSMIAGGGVGNMIDRTFYGEQLGYGEVIDFVDFCAFPKIWTYIFNIADAFVCIGAGLFLLAVILDAVRESREKKKGVAAEAEPPETVGTAEAESADTSDRSEQMEATETVESAESLETAETAELSEPSEPVKTQENAAESTCDGEKSDESETKS
ncbi:MAG: signal peptidase II [Eubacteriales bacterium]